MPKETVNTDDARVAVGWTPDLDVQIGVELQPFVVVNGEHRPRGVTFTGGGPSAFTTLRRSDINRLIRALRRARDAAYGQDA